MLFIDFAALGNKSVVLRVACCLRGFNINVLVRRSCRVFHLYGDGRKRFANLLSEVAGKRLIGELAVAVHSTLFGRPAEQHFGMLIIVGIDIVARLEAIISLIWSNNEIFPGVGSARFALFEHKYIRHDIRACIALESSVGKSHSAEQIGPVCNILSYGVIGGIHRIPARNEQHNAAGAHFIKRLGKEIVVNR